MECWIFEIMINMTKIVEETEINNSTMIILALFSLNYMDIQKIKSQ